MNELHKTAFLLGEVSVDPARLVFELDGQERRVEPRVMEILVYLAENAGKTVSREQLREQLWDAYVTDDAIHRGVWKLRRALAAHGDLIETVSKRGYRLTRRPRPLPTAVSEVPVAAGPPPRAERLVRLGGVAITVALVLLALALGLRDTRLPATERDVVIGSADLDFVPLSSMPGYESQPVLTPSGDTVVFAHFAKSGDDAFQWDLWQRTMPDGPTERLTATAGHEMSPAISPDGRRVAFVAMDATGGCSFATLVRATGERVALGMDCGVARGGSDCCRRIGWLDEERLVFSRRAAVDEPVRLYTSNGLAGSAQALTDPPAQWDGDTDFAISPDGRQLAFVRRRTPEIADLWVHDLDSGETQRLTSEGYPINGLAWSHDAANIIFGWSRTGRSVLWEVPALGGWPRPVATAGMNASNPTVGKEVLIYEEWTSEINLVEIDLGVPNANRVASSGRWDWGARVAPEGARVAFLSNRGGPDEILLLETRGSEPRRLLTSDAPLASAPEWSPDGRQVVVSAARGASGLDLATVNVETGTLTWLVEDASDERAPVFSRSGDEVLFASNRTGEWEIHAIELTSGRVRRWTHGGGIAARSAADGPGILFARPGAAGLWRQDRHDGEATLVAADFAPSAPADWTVHGSSVFFTRLDTAFVAWLSRLDTTTGATVDLAQLDAVAGFTELFAGAGLWVAPDGASVLLSGVDVSRSDLWLARPRR